MTLNPASDHNNLEIQEIEVSQFEGMNDLLQRNTTPWGEPEEIVTIADGIFRVHTERHGGFCLSPERLNAVPDYILMNTIKYHGFDGWFEEDCEACWMELLFPEEMQAFCAAGGHSWQDSLAASHRMLEHNYPEEYFRFLRENPEAVARMQRQ